MKRLITLLSLCCLMATGAWADISLDLSKKYYIQAVNGSAYVKLNSSGNATLSATPETQFEIAADTDGGYTIHADNGYLIGSGWDAKSSSEAEVWTIEETGEGFLISQTHATHKGKLGFDSNAAGSKLYCNKGNTYFNFVDASVQRAKVTYIYKIGTREWCREEVQEPVGSTVSAPPTKAFATLSYDTSLTVAADGTTTVEVTCTPQLPFTAFESASAITQWYAFRAHANNTETRWLYDNEGTLGFYQGDHPNTADYAWGFVGNLIDGFEIVNMKSGLILSDENPCTLNTTHNRVTLCKSNVNNSGFAMKTTGDYYNYNSGSQAIKRWQDADNGSTFFVQAMTVETTGYTVTVTGLTDELLDLASVSVNNVDYKNGANISTTGLTTDDVTVNPVPGYHGEASIQNTSLIVSYTPVSPITLPVTFTPASGLKVSSLDVIRVNFGAEFLSYAEDMGLTASDASLTCGGQSATLQSCTGEMDADENTIMVYTFSEVTTDGNWTFTIPSGNYFVWNSDGDMAPVATITAHYTIGENTPADHIDVTYNIVCEGEVISSTTIENEAVGKAPTFVMPELPGYVTLQQGLPETLTASDTEVNILTVYSANMPFTVGDDYSIVLNGKTTSWNGTNFPLGNASGNKMAFTVGGDWLNGFTFKNKEADKYLSFGTSANPADNTKATVTTNANEAGARLDLVVSGGKNYLKIHGTTNNSYANNRNSYFSTWTTASPDAGSQVTFTALATYTLTITGDLDGKNPYVAIGGTQYHNGDQVMTVANLNKSALTPSDITGRTTIIEINGTEINVRYVQGQQTSGNPTGATVQADKIYRIYSVRHAGWMMTERLNNTVGTINIKATNDYAQMWVVTANGSDAYSIRNVNTGRYIQFPGQNSTAQTTTSAVKSYIINKNATSHYYGISENADGSGNKNLNTNTAMDNVVGWSMGDDVGSQWVFEEVPTSEITLAAVKTRIKSLSPFSTLESGKYYRLQSYTYTDRYMAEAYTTDGKIWGYQPANVGNLNSLIWKITGDATNGYTLQNVLTQHYIADQGSTSAQFPTTANASSAKKFMVHAEGGDDWSYPHYAFHRSSSDQNSLHCASSQNYWVVKWTYNGANASFWNLEPVELSADQLAAIAQEYADYMAEAQDVVNVNTNATSLNATLHKYFADYACTTLNEVYANKTDAELTAAMADDGLSEPVQQMALRVKNDTWNTTSETHNKWEKFFRISPFECYSKNTKWNGITGTGAFAELINPTGITVSIGDVVYIYVDADPADADATIGLQLSNDTNVRAGARIDLHKGINAWMATGNGELFIDYTLNNTEKYLRDYPAIKVHIEGGTPNGCWDMHRGMTNADWTWLCKNAFKNTFLHVKGESTVLNLLAANVKGATDPVRIMKGWDFAFEHLQRLIGHDGQWDGRYRPVINPRHSYSGAPNWGGYGGSNHPSVTSGYLFNYDNFYNGNIWEILHEEGHGHSGPINCAGMTEISNNSLSQMVSYEWGLNYSRGEGGKGLMEMFNYTLDGTKRGWTWVDFMRYADPYYDYSLHVANQMLYHLYLYFDVQGHFPGFMPRVYDWLRANGGIQKGSSIANPTIYKNDYLKLAQACAEVTQTDLSEFFEAHGMFKYYEDVLSHRDQDDDPTAQANHILYIGDYGGYFMKMPSKSVPEDVAFMNEFIQNMKNMPNKAPNILFMEDRIKQQTVSPDSPVAQLDPTVAGKEKVRYWAIDKMGDFGQYTDFTDTNNAASIDYTISSETATLTLKDLSKQDFNQTGKTVTVTGDGLVGLKIYDADGHLVYLANTREFFVPTDIATGLQNGTYTLVAALADQTNLPLAKPGTTTYELTVYNGTEDNHQTYQSSGTTPNANIPYTTNGGKDYPTLTDNAIQMIEAENTSSLPTAFRNKTNTLYKVDDEWEAYNINLTDKKDFYAPEMFSAKTGSYQRTNTAGLNSVCLPFSISTDLLPTDSKIYVLSNVGETALTFTEADYTYPGQFCLIDCPDDTAWNITVPADEYYSGTPDTDENAIGSFQNKTVGEGHYKLNGDGTKFGITTAAGKVTAFRGYIDAPAAAGVKSLSFRLEDATVGVDCTPAAAHESMPAYDLQGHQIAPIKENGALTLQRGQTYIINGKKMIVR